MTHPALGDRGHQRRTRRLGLAGPYAAFLAVASAVLSAAHAAEPAPKTLSGAQHVAMPEKALPADAKDQPPLQFWQEARTQPRTLRVSCVKVDLRCPRYEVAALVADDPDGPGPAESQLESPLTLASRNKAIAAVNTNAFNRLPDPPSKPQGAWAVGRPADIRGWAVTGGRQISPPDPANASFWIDPKGAAHIGALAAPKEAREAVAGFAALLVNGQDVSKEGTPLHPRTALGLDREGRWLWLVVVDGRQAGYSEGMALRELSALMKDLGCWDALNLDGGGSSTMLVADDKGTLQVMNRPSDRDAQGRPLPRSVPIMLGVRPR